MGLDIIIPTKGKTDYLFKCLQSIIDKTTIDYHVYIADTGSTKEEFASIIEFVKNKFQKNKNVSVFQYDYYNFAKINNHVVNNYCENDTLLFCNNDIELIDACVDTLCELARRDEVGTAGCRLLFEDGSVQHAGQIAFTHRPPSWTFPQDKLEVTHRGLRTRKRFESVESVMGNTAALMCVKREKFDQIGGFNVKYNECFEDVEFNMNMLLAGYNNIYTDDYSATHAESVSRTKSPQAMKKLERDYLDNLYPFWNGLSTDQQQVITNFKA